MKQALLPGITLNSSSRDELVAEPELTFGFLTDFPEADAPAAPLAAPPFLDAKPENPALHADQHLLPGTPETLPGFSLVATFPAPFQEDGEESGRLHIFTPSHPAPEPPPVTVIGLGMGGRLSPEAIRALKHAEALAVPSGLVKRFGRSKAAIIPLTPLEPALRSIEEHRRQGRHCVVLADGDPLLYGIGATLARRLPPEALSIVPAVSALQAACARLALPWHNIRAVSLHGRNDWAPLAHAALEGDPVCVYTDARRAPAHIARFLLERGVDWYRMAVASRLGTPQEHVALWELAEAAEQDFTGGETAVLIPTAPPAGPRLGLDESTLVLDGGLYTKAPVRAAALSLLRLSPSHIVWDIGAGSGCLSLEAAALVPRGRVFAVEQRPDRVLCIQENRRRLGVPHLEIVSAFAPLGLDALPDPDAVFLGGGLGPNEGYGGGSPVGPGPEEDSGNVGEGLDLSGDAGKERDGSAAMPDAEGRGEKARRFPGPRAVPLLDKNTAFDQATQSTLLLNALFARLRPGGTLVAACALLSSLHFLTRYLQSHGLKHDVTLVQASVSSPLAGSLALKGQNPVFLVRVAV